MLQAQVNSTAALVFLVLLLMFIIILAYWSAISYAEEPVRTSRPRYTGPRPDGKGTLLISYSDDIPYFVEPWWKSRVWHISREEQNRRQENRDSQSSEED